MYVGVGNPVMIVFFQGDEKPRSQPLTVKGGKDGPKGKGGDGIGGLKTEDRGSKIGNLLTGRASTGSTPPPLAPEGPAQWFQPPQLHVNSTLAEPVTGSPMVHFDWRQATVHCQDFDWQVAADGHVLARFGNRELEARQALRALQTLQLTERFQVGDSSSFFLSNSEPAHGLFFGGKNELCHPDALSLKRLGLRWMIWEYDRSILALGKSQEEAEQVLKIFQHYKVDHVCQIGTSDPPPVTILVKTR
jgi:hypothetical protein